MLTLSRALDPAAVALNLPATTEWEAILSVAELLRDNPGVVAFDRFCEAVIAREKLSPTASPNGVAFPHARSEAVRQIVMAIGRSDAGIRFGEAGSLVHFVIVIGTPKEMVREYLHLIGQLARLFKSQALRDELMQAQTPADFLARLLAEISE